MARVFAARIGIAMAVHGVQACMAHGHGCGCDYHRPTYILHLTWQASEPLRGVALVLRERGRLQQALDALDRALVIAPADPQLYIDRGITHDYAERREVRQLANRADHAPLGAWWMRHSLSQGVAAEACGC